MLGLIRIMTRPEMILLRFLIGDVLRLSPWKFFFLARFVAYCESCAQDRKTVVLEIMTKKNVLPHLVIFPVNSKIHATP